MDDQANKDGLEESIEQSELEPASILTKLKQARTEYSPDGKNPNPEMFDYVDGLIGKWEQIRKGENRRKEAKLKARKRAKASRKKNRRR